MDTFQMKNWLQKNSDPCKKLQPWQLSIAHMT